MKLNKKGQAFEQLGKLAMGVVTLAIILVVGFMILSQSKEQISETEGWNSSGQCLSAGCNATDEVVGGLDDIPGWIPIVIIVGIGIVLIGMVKTFSKG